ncbi:hypothetical protein LCGC14_1279960 [marine sediment metagenome]|uniref:Uncharacterized protein n=1 Tax=marine sediment metagenome TaxID=412755 RepID=A0A0F9KVI9_9ZZZZ
MGLFIAALNDSRDHFEPFVGFYGIFGVGGNNYGLARFQGLRFVVYQDFGTPFYNLDEGIEPSQFIH